MKLFTILYNNSISFCLKNSIKTFLYYLVKLDSKFKKYIFSLLKISVLCIFCLNIISIFFINTFANATELTLEEYVREPYGNVIFLRHALAPGFDAKGKPNKFKIDDCSTQRNLNTVGIDQAIELGKIFSESGLIFKKIYSSQWCRCMETAKLLNLGKVFPEVSLNSGFMGIYKKEISLAKLSKLLDELKNKEGLFLMVTHYGTISAVTGIVVDSGAAVAYNVKTKSSLEVLLK